MSDKAKAMERLIQSVVTGEKLRTATNAELADLMREHVWAGLMMCSAVADLVSEVMDRLRGLKTCASCHGWGYVEHARCIPCGGTGDVAPSADAASRDGSLKAQQIIDGTMDLFPGADRQAIKVAVGLALKPPADAETEAARIDLIHVVEWLETGHPMACLPLFEGDGHKAREKGQRLRTLLAALSAPAPAPSAKETK